MLTDQHDQEPLAEGLPRREAPEASEPEEPLNRQHLRIEQRPSEKIELPEKLKDFFNVPFQVSIELGRSKVKVRDLLDLRYHSVFELSKSVGSNLDVYVNDVLLGRGEVVVLEEKVGIKINEIA